MYRRLNRTMCWGHLDYIVRYSNQGSKGFDLNDYMDIIEEILKTGDRAWQGH